MKVTQPIRDKKQVKKIVTYYKSIGEFRNWVLVTLCVHTALRISDILNLKTEDVYDFEKKKVRTSINIKEIKTGKSKEIALHPNIVYSLEKYMDKTSKGQALILNSNTNKAISRVQAYRLIRDAAQAVEIENNVSCHSLRKTFGYHAWKNGVSPAVLMEIYNHSSLSITRRYLGVCQDDKNAVYIGFKY